MGWRIRLLVSLGLLIALYACWGREFIAVDRCLDAGGRWNYELSICQTK
jgi:hypothetical protein